MQWGTCCVAGIFIGKLFSVLWYVHVHVYVHWYFIRTWKGHIKGTQHENQVEIYQMLCLLEAELNPSKFHQLLRQFIQYWTLWESAFVKFFEQQYANRPGKRLKCTCTYNYQWSCIRNMGKMLSALQTWGYCMIQICMLRGNYSHINCVVLTMMYVLCVVFITSWRQHNSMEKLIVVLTFYLMLCLELNVITSTGTWRNRCYFQSTTDFFQKQDRHQSAMKIGTEQVEVGNCFQYDNAF